MSDAANSLDEFWIPFTANRDFKADPRLFVRAEGVHYWNHRGDRILDGSSGLFCCAAGHGRAEIADAVHAQLQEMDFAPPFQSSHPKGFELARRVAELTPGNLNRVFFGNSGSEAVDTAMKIAMAYFRARGEDRRVHFVTREKAYHGVNIGGTSLSGIPKNAEGFQPLMPGVVHLRHTWLPENRFTRGQGETGAELAEDLQKFCDELGGDNIAACFIEPIAGSIGVLVPPKGYLERIREICDANGILLVFDEVITGFGRTGKAFAADSFGIQPDLMTLAKALTNGAQPMGVVAVRDDIYETITEAAAPGAIEFFHGYTYSAHPAACVASLAVLDIYARENLFDRAAQLSGPFQDAVFGLEGLDAIADIRGYGMLAAFELKEGAINGAGPGASGIEVQKRLFRAGLHVKFTGDSGLIAPPFIATEDDIMAMADILRDVIEKI